jgi:AhpD family alkylhydroperoxidase
MTRRANPFLAAPKAVQAWMDFGQSISDGLEHSLAELVKMRASQINGCANCLAMHGADARKAGEAEHRLWLLAAWRETKVFTARERAALAWTEHLTQVADARAPDEVYADLAAQFTPEEQTVLTLQIVAINGWNRLAIGFEIDNALKPLGVAA